MKTENPGRRVRRTESARGRAAGHRAIAFLCSCAIVLVFASSTWSQPHSFKWAPKNDNLHDSLTKTADTIRPLIPLVGGLYLRIGLELYLGAGIMHDLSRVQPPPDSLPFPSGSTTLKALQFRGRVYLGPLGGLAFIDRSAKPVYTHFESHGLPYGAGTTSSQLLLSLYLDFWHNRLHMEPLYGYGWISDNATIGRRGEPMPYDARSKAKGRVIGWEQIVRFGDGTQFRVIYTHGSYKISDKRLKLEIQASTQAVAGSKDLEKLRRYGGFSISLGLHQVWRGDGRKERIVYLGAGILIG